MACLVICLGLALPGKTQAEETASEIVAQTGLTHTATAQTVPATPDTSAALRRVIALRQELEAQVKALSRLVAYQKELLALANTRDVDAVLRARRARQTCLEEIGTAALCDALSVSFTDDPVTPLSGLQASPAEAADDPVAPLSRLQASPAEAVDDKTDGPTVDNPTLLDDPTVQDRGDGG